MSGFHAHVTKPVHASLLVKAVVRTDGRASESVETALNKLHTEDYRCGSRIEKAMDPP